MPKKRGRPSKYTEKLADEICRRISCGASLIAVSRDDDMPGESTLYRWLQEKDGFWEKYARAREARAERMMEELRDIADSATPENVQVAKLQVDTSKWIISKMLPKKYGDAMKHEHTGEDGQPLQFIIKVKDDHAKDG